ncbi:HvfC/BufC N-terminal domain-containing protein [bacterium endosymbiont of Bathymodiolus sp. 5 South]|uniref:HvfC/BufC N-terminal domain-containing protein n=1 Tax=bacterium endosymbiont of Bathymodiolus sp. 5 South TaxID=1181670 RepID=UPI0010BB8FA1|nr:DNA-binding domain-containing protein [bacterium endosymbiont of Bathymodiolus sp. 5 South]SHN92888.1 hypothetical protein BCLUESOX_143 [bacterium endosymbiont of Bathymodiolus sp. 5 South]VVH59356.1 hypothetical protein BSPCLSOX_128 [uncultured Gammaproteobacteria bacterium]
MKDRALKQLQRDFYQDVLTVESVSKNYLNKGNFTAQDLIQIYRNQYFLSLRESLAKSYSCVKRLVGEDFFNKLAKDFIIAHPSTTGNIIDYGDEFSNFIKLSPDCKTVSYLADIAKLERYYERCYFSDIVFFMASVYPVIKIWQLNENSEQLDLASGGDYLKIYRQGAQVLVAKITPQEYKERQ